MSTKYLAFVALFALATSAFPTDPNAASATSSLQTGSAHPPHTTSTSATNSNASSKPSALKPGCSDTGPANVIVAALPGAAIQASGQSWNGKDYMVLFEDDSKEQNFQLYKTSPGPKQPVNPFAIVGRMI